jgi:quinol monooxygenase YgiN
LNPKELEMVVIHVSARVKDETVTNFEQRLREVVEDARRTAGCLKYEWYRDPDISNHFIIYGEFDAEDNFEAYLKSSVVERIGEELMPLLEGEPQFKHYQATVLE